MEFILGPVVSLIVQALKRRLGSDAFTMSLSVISLSFAAAAVYVLIADTAIWPLFVKTVTTAGAFYTFIIRRFETAGPMFTLD
jgi:hypothetical protein